MSDQLIILAEDIGPIRSLYAPLSKRKENLIFAPNGTGKTFLARALRCLDFHKQGKDIDKLAKDIISEEASTANFSISYNGEKDKFTLNKGNLPSVTPSNHIFHVFSENFIHEELRGRSYAINDEIEGSIALDIGSDLNKIKEAEAAYKQAEAQEQDIFNKLQTAFERAKETELQAKTNLNRGLQAYKSLNLNTVLSKLANNSFNAPKSLSQIVTELETLKSIPDNPTLPKGDPFSIDIDWHSLNHSLQKITSPSIVAADIKAKIEKHKEFYRTGLEIHNEHSDICPFCEQNTASDNAKNLIESYIKYFADAEEKHKTELSSFYKKIKDKDIEIKASQNTILRTKSVYDELKQYIPSQKKTQLQVSENEFDRINKLLSEILKFVIDKGKDLSIDSSLSNKENELLKQIKTLNQNIDENNKKIDSLTKILNNTNEERKSLQEQACFAFEKEFAEKHKTEIDDFNNSQREKERKKEARDKAGEDAPKQDIKERVADTFGKILKYFFGEKYTFNASDFTLKRGESAMQRGNDKTLSEGEKSIIAFCYFIASIHRKVKTQSDYKNLFLVFDDPVTSLSYDYVYRISEILRNIHISKLGEVQWNNARKSFKNSDPDGNPRLLVLTHSTYFFNLLSVNKIIMKGSIFQLKKLGDEHKIEPLIKCIAPFDHQLEHIYRVSKEAEKPQHYTGVSVRAVIEATIRICYPNKCNNGATIFEFLTKEKGYSFKSQTLVNMTAHGIYFNESAPPDDIILACEEAVEIVKKLLPGQIEQLENKGTQQTNKC